MVVQIGGTGMRHHLDKPGESLKESRLVSFIIRGGIGLGVVAVGVTLAVLRGIENQSVQEAVRHEHIMALRLDTLYERMYREAEEAFARDDFYAPGLRFVDGTIAILSEHVGQIRREQRTIVQCALELMLASRTVTKTYYDAWEQLEALGVDDPASLGTIPVVRERIESVYEVRLANHNEHVALLGRQREYYDRLITAAVDPRIAAEEARDFATGSRFDVQLRICELERAELDLIQEQLELMISTWGKWSPSRDEEHVTMVRDDRAFEQFEALHNRQVAIHDELKSLNRTLFSRPAP